MKHILIILISKAYIVNKWGIIVPYIQDIVLFK
jgi:hypothetical protein